MRGGFDEETYDSICEYLFQNNHTKTVGADRITASNFLSHKNENYDVIKRKYENGTYKFTRLQKVQLDNRAVYIPTCRDKVVLEFLCRNVKRRYKLKLKSRVEIADELNALFNEPIDYYVIRLDVSHFFESIDHDKLVQRLKNDSLFSLNELSMVKNLLERYGMRGVPQGVGLSNYLTEIYMKPFDLYMSRISSNLVYYSRYVDDILLIFPGGIVQEEKRKIDENILKIFEVHGLSCNEKKQQKVEFYKVECNPITYLGYSYQRKNNTLKVEIADYKFWLFQARIDKMFDSYLQTGKFELLKERMFFFSSIHIIYKTVYKLNQDNSICYFKKKCIYGIRADYAYASDESIQRINDYLAYKIMNVSGLSKKNRNELFSCRVRYKSQSPIIIDDNSITIQAYRRKIYYLQDTSKYTWRDLVSKNKYELIKLYYDLVRV